MKKQTRREQLGNKTLNVLIPVFSLLSTATCYDGRGRFYQGSVNITRSGIQCQPWNKQVCKHEQLSKSAIIAIGGSGIIINV